MKIKLIILLLISLVNASYSSISKLTHNYEIICKDIYVTATPWFLDNKLKSCFIIAKEDLKASSKIGGNKQKTWFICPKKASEKYNSKDQ